MFLRRFLKFVLGLVLFVLLGLGLVLIPAVQTWFAQRVLSERLHTTVSIGSVWGRFGKLEVEDLRIGVADGVLTIPRLEAEMPLVRALRRGDVAARKITIKGWTLDLAHVPPSNITAGTADESAPADTESSREQPRTDPASVFKALCRAVGALITHPLPFDFSADGIEAEGEVLLPSPSSREPFRGRVVLGEAGIGAGRSASLKLAVDGSLASINGPDLTASGSLVVSMDTPRTFNRLAWSPEILVKTNSETPVSLRGDLELLRTTGRDSFRVALSRADRRVVSLELHRPQAGQKLAGGWTIALSAGDLKPFFKRSDVNALSVAGAGDFETDTSLEQLRAWGQLKATTEQPHRLSSTLQDLGSLTLDTEFDLVAKENALNVSRLAATLIRGKTIARAEAVQPFAFDLKTGIIVPSSANQDWVAGSLTDAPFNLLSAFGLGWQLSSGEVSGKFGLRTTNGSFSLVGKEPFTAVHAQIAKDGALLARDLDVRAQVTATYNSEQWQVECASGKLSGDGRPLGTLELKVTRPSNSKRPLAVAAKWNLDLLAALAQPILLNVRNLGLRSSTGDLSITVGAWINYSGDAAVTLGEDRRTVSAKVNTDLRRDGSVSFRVPFKIRHGEVVTELSTEGTWYPLKAGHELNASVSSKALDLQTLQTFGPALAMLVHPSPAPTKSRSADLPADGAPQSREEPDAAPFWGDVQGRITFSVQQFTVGGSELRDLHGNLRLEPGVLRLEHGIYQLSNRLAGANAAITFSRAETPRYHVTGSFDDGEIDANPLFAAPSASEDPPFHGKFTVASTLKGEGNNWKELLEGTQQQFHLKSTSGIVRFLKTHVTGVSQEKESKIGNAADVVGTLFGKVAGIKRNSIRTGQIRLNKKTDAILNFSYDCAEIGYTELTLTAARSADGKFHIQELSLLSPDKHITGAGEIPSVTGQPLLSQPLTFEMKFAVRDDTAASLADTGLLSSEKDSLGYTLFKETVRLSGTLKQLDVGRWHDLLLNAALRTTETKTR